MLTYISRRLIACIPLLIGISLVSFFVIHLAPGKPTDLMSSLNPKVSLQVRERLERLYGLDRPLWVQFRDWFLRLLRLDFGNSFMDGMPVMERIKERLPVTLAINSLSLFLILLLGIPLGVRAALRPYGVFDKLTTVFVFLGFAAPTFWLSLLLLDLLGVRLGWLPVSGLTSIDFENLSLGHKCIDLSRHLALPLLVSSFTSLAGISRYTRANMMNVLHTNYIRTARAKGLPESRLLYAHALPNAMLAVITILGLSLPGLIGGSVIFETIFAIPGVGQLFFEAVMSRDYPLIMAELVLGAILTLLGNLLADIGYAWCDPRIRFGTRTEAGS